MSLMSVVLATKRTIRLWNKETNKTEKEIRKARNYLSGLRSKPKRTDL